MQALLSPENRAAVMAGKPETLSVHDAIAKEAYELADAMAFAGAEHVVEKIALAAGDRVSSVKDGWFVSSDVSHKARQVLGDLYFDELIGSVRNFATDGGIVILPVIACSSAGQAAARR